MMNSLCAGDESLAKWTWKRGEGTPPIAELWVIDRQPNGTSYQKNALLSTPLDNKNDQKLEKKQQFQTYICLD